MKRKAPWRWPHQFINVPPGPQADGHGACDGGRRLDHHTEQRRAERYDESARGRGGGEGHVGVCPYRSRRRGESGWAVAAADRGLDLWCMLAIPIGTVSIRSLTIRLGAASTG